MLEETIENLNKQFIDSFGELPLKIASKEEAFLITDAWLVPYLQFVKKNKRVLKLVGEKPQVFQARASYQKMYDKIFYPAISQFVSKETDRIYKLEFFTNGLAAVVHKWLALDCETEIDEIVDVIKNCIDYQRL